MNHKNRSSTEVRLICDIYDAFLRNSSAVLACAAMEITTAKLSNILKRDPDCAEAKNLADERRQRDDTFGAYVVGRLSPEAKEAYEKIQFWKNHKSYAEKVDAILLGKSKKIRQELFVHTLAATTFDINEACRTTGVNRAQLEEWRMRDFEFRQMVQEIEFIKKNWYEAALHSLVQDRNPGAVMFVNKTQNRDRGYGEKVTHEHTGTIAHVAVNIDDLDLPIDTRRTILDALRKKQTEKQVIDVSGEMNQLVERT